MKIKHLNKKYYALNGEIVHALKDINLEFKHYGLYAILGPSGCGKSTFLNCIGGFHGFDEGSIEILGQNIHQLSDEKIALLRANDIGYLFQSDHLIESMTVYENILFPLQLIDQSIDHQAIEQMMITLEVDHLKDRLPKELSIGQRQRVALIRTVVKHPVYILADEPTGALDEETSHILMKFLKLYSKQAIIVMVTHDESIAKTYANRIIRLKDGSVVQDITLNEANTQEVAKVQDNNQRLSFVHILHMVKTNISIRLTRSIWTMILTMVTLLFFSISMVSSQYDEDQAYLYTIDKNQVQYFPIEKGIYKADSIGDVYSYDANFDENDIEWLSNEFQQDLIYKIDGYRHNLYTLQSNDEIFNSYYDHFIIEGYIPISSDLLNLYQLDIIGDLPEKNEQVVEIMISSYIADILLKYGISTIENPMASINDLIDNTFTLDQETFKITGIVDTNFDSELFEPLQSIEQDGLLTEEMGHLNDLLSVTLENDIHLSFFVYEEFYEEEIIEKQMLEMPLETGKSINYYQSSIGIDERRLSIWLDVHDDVIYRNQLDDNYIVIPFDSLDITIRLRLLNDIEEQMISLVSMYANQNFDRLKDEMPQDYDVDDYINYILINDENIYDATHSRDLFNKTAEQDILSSYLEQEDMMLTIDYEDDIYQFQQTYQIGGIYNHPQSNYEIYVSQNLYETLGQFKYPMIKHIYMINTGDEELESLFESQQMDNDSLMNYDYQASDIYAKGIESLSETTEIFSGIFLYASFLAFILTFLIYQINMTNRISLSIKDVGIFSALGVGKKDISKIFIYEALVMSLISLVMSIIASFLAIVGLNMLMTKDMYIDLHIYSFSGVSVLVVTLIAIILPVISSVLPLRKLLQLKPIDIINEAKK